MELFKSFKIGKIFHWIIWLLSPLTGGLRLIIFLPIVIFIYFGVKSSFISIPPKEKLTQVEGRFLAPQNKMAKRRSQYATRVADNNGIIYKCDCSFGGILKANCLSDNYELNNEYIEILTNKKVSLLLAPGLMGGGDLCYKLTSEERIWFDYNEKSKRYITAKNGWYLKISWLLLIIILLFTVIRGLFFKERGNG